MLEAFTALGYDADVVSGYSAERSKKIAGIKKNIANGEKYEFMYAESSTMPTLLTDRHHLPLNPTLDFGFFSCIKNNGIPIGLFYRDIYWCFPPYEEKLSVFKASVARFFYRYDLTQYRKYIDRLYLPSLGMGKYIPSFPAEKMKALPPGHSGLQSDYVKQKKTDDRLSLLYVGGMSSHYQMHAVFEALRDMPGIRLSLCTRKAEWEMVKEEYGGDTSENIKIFHVSGSGLDTLYADADIAMLFVNPHEYWDFAAPVKLYEYLGALKPVIASKGTLAGRFVEENGIGWTIPYRTETLSELLIDLKNNPQEIEKVQQCCMSVAVHHNWRMRAQQVVDELTGIT